MQQINLTVDLKDQEHRDQVVRYMKCDDAWKALYEIREHLHEAYLSRSAVDSRLTYNLVLEILAKRRIDLDFHMDPPERPQL